MDKRKGKKKLKKSDIEKLENTSIAGAIVGGCDDSCGSVGSCALDSQCLDSQCTIESQCPAADSCTAMNGSAAT